MKKLSYIVLVALLALPAATLYAQSTGTWFKVPFPFTVADKSMPVGQYFVEGLWYNAVAIHQSKGQVGLIVLGQPALRAGSEAKLIFHRYDNHYFLSEVRLPNMDSGRAFAAGKEEVKLAKAQKRAPNVEVAGR
jgi:hypothetical protein